MIKEARNMTRAAGVFFIVLGVLISFGIARQSLLTATYGGFTGDEGIGVEYDFHYNGTFTLTVFEYGQVKEQTEGKYIVTPFRSLITISYDKPVEGVSLPKGTLYFKKGFDYIRIGDSGFLINPHIAERLTARADG